MDIVSAPTYIVSAPPYQNHIGGNTYYTIKNNEIVPNYIFTQTRMHFLAFYVFT